MTFEEFGFDERIQKGIDEAGFKNPMPVQAQCFELLIKDHRDIYAQSQTGTGKTAAFLLGIFQLLLIEEKYKGQKALIVVPTRELAVQIEAEGKMLGKYLDLKIGSVYGGVGYGAQEKMLQDGVDIIVGTPGRLIDFTKQRKINLKDFGFLVIDEADRLFDMGFLPDLRRILKGMRPYNERHTLLFSATLNARVGNLAWEYMNDPGEVIIEPDKITVDTVSQELYHVGKDEKMKLLLGVLKRDAPENAVIFTNTRHSAWEVAKRLEVNGYAVEFLMGDLPQSRRLKIVEEVKNGRHKFLVATDVAARGLHIDELEMVINYDVPLEAESYVHRIGRTARAGREGKTVTMACEEYVYGLGPIEKLLGEKLPVSWAEEDIIAEDKSEGMRFPPQQRYRELDGGNNRGRGGHDDRRPRDSRPGGDRNRSESRSRDDRPRENRNRDDRPRENRNRDDRPRENRNRDDRPRENRNRDDRGDAQPQEQQRDKDDKNPRTPGNGNRPPAGGKRPLDPRAAKIQSVVSNIAGGSLDDFSETKGTRPEKKRTDSKPERKADDGRGSKGQSRKKNNTDRRPRVDNDTERVSSNSSIDERLEYYRKKYGEDFQFSGSAGRSAKKSAKIKKSQAGQKPGKSSGSGNRGSQGQKGKRPASKPENRQKRPDSGKKGPESSGEKIGETASTPEKKGLLGRLFKK